MVKKKSFADGLGRPQVVKASHGNLAGDKTSALPATEIIDQNGEPFAVIELQQAHSQLLAHKSVIVLVYDTQGRLYIKRRAKHKSRFPSKLDCSVTGHLRPDEGRLEAALRLIEEGLGLSGARLSLILREKATADNIEDVSVYCAKGVNRRICLSARHAEDGFFVSRTEFDCLLRDFHELLTPALVRLEQLGQLFN